MRNKTTIKDVAKSAGVCHKTVSNYLNKTANVKEETAEMIKRAISELNYIPNLYARGLRTGKTKTIALIESFIQNPVNQSVIKGLQEELYKVKYFLNIISIEKIVPIDEIIKLPNLLSYDGIILGAVSRDLVMYFNSLKVPFISLARHDDIPENIFKIQIDLNKAGGMVAEYLIKNNHRKIGFFMNKSELEIKDFNYLRKGFSDRLRQENLKMCFEYKTPLEIGEIDKVFKRDKDYIIKSITIKASC